MPSFREKLKALEELQRIDLRVLDLAGQTDLYPRARAEIEAAVAAAKKVCQEERTHLLDNERERRQVDSLLGMEKEKVKKWEGRLGEIRTPREYAALSREIDIAKKSNEAQLEQVRTLTAAAVEIQKALSDKEAAQVAAEQKGREDLAAIEKGSADAQSSLANLEAARREQADKVDPGLLGRYENIKRRRAGTAIVPVVGNTCKGCNMNIPPQLANILRRADSIETCPNCQRIIYSAEAVNPPQTPSA